jgi:AbrB family looped-hinge helix DNA binding protein
VKSQCFISKVIADGRLTIPKELREKKGIEEGDFVEVQLIRKIGPTNTVEA